MNQISQFHGRFRTVRAIDFDPGNVALLDEMQDVAEHSKSDDEADPPRVGWVLVQGLAFDFTPLVLALEPLAFPVRLPVHGDLGPSVQRIARALPPLAG